MEDGEALLARFNRLMRDLEAGSTNRNSFQPWEIELLLDIAACDLDSANRRRTLQRYCRAVERMIHRGAARPMKLSEYLARSGARRCAILESQQAS